MCVQMFHLRIHFHIFFKVQYQISPMDYIPYTICNNGSTIQMHSIKVNVLKWLYYNNP